MSKREEPVPTTEEVRAAQELLARHEAALAEAERAAVQPILDVTQAPAFSETLDAMSALDPSFFTDPRFGPALQAARTGMQSLVRAVGRVVPLEAAAEPAR